MICILHGTFYEIPNKSHMNKACVTLKSMLSSLFFAIFAKPILNKDIYVSEKQEHSFVTLQIIYLINFCKMRWKPVLIFIKWLIQLGSIPGHL